MSFTEFLISEGGFFIGILGAALAVILSGVGSAKGVQVVGEASAALVMSEPSKFG